MSLDIGQNIGNLEELAAKVLSADFSLKLQAENLLKKLFVQKMCANLLQFIFTQGSDQLLFVACELLHRQLFKYPPQLLIAIYIALKQLIKSIFDTNQSIFRRTQKQQQSVIPNFVVNSINLLLGECMKFIHVKMLENKQVSSENKIPQINQFLTSIEEDRDNTFCLYLWNCYFSSVSNIDHGLTFTQYRQLSYSFQKYVIPQITRVLASTTNNDIEYLQSEIDFKEIETLQAQLCIDDLVKYRPPKKNEHFQNYSKIIKRFSRADLIINLLHMICCYPYNIVYSQYEAGQTIFDHCLISFPQQVTEYAVQNRLIESIAGMLLKLLEIVGKFLNYKQGINISNTKELNMLWQAFNKFILMRISDLSSDLQRKFHITVTQTAISIVESIMKIYEIVYTHKSLPIATMKALSNLFRLCVQSFNYISTNTETQTIINLQEQINQPLFYDYIAKFSLFNIAIFELFPITEQHELYGKLIKFWARFEEEKPRTGYLTLSLYYSEYCESSKVLGNMAKLQRKENQSVVENEANVLKNYLLRLLSKQRNCIFGELEKLSDLSLEYLQESSEINFQNIEDLFFFWGKNNYNLLIQNPMHEICASCRFPADSQKPGFVNYLLLCSYLVNSYPAIEKDLKDQMGSQPHLYDTVTNTKLNLKQIFGMPLKYIMMKQRVSQNMDRNLAEEVIEYASILYIYRFMYQILSNLTFQCPKNSYSQSKNNGIKNQHFQEQIIVISHSELIKHLSMNCSITSPFCQLSNKINESLSIILEIMTPTFGLLPQKHHLLDLLNERGTRLEVLLIWGYSFFINKIKFYTDQAFVNHNNGHIITLLSDLYTKFHLLVSKYKWTLYRQKFCKTKAGKYLIEAIKHLFEATVRNLNNSAVLHETGQRQVIGVMECREKLMKIVAMLMFDDINDNYHENISAVIDSIASNYTEARLSNSHIKVLCTIHDVIGVMESVDTSKIWKRCVTYLDQKVKLTEFFDYVFTWVLHLPTSNYQVREKIMRNITRLFKVFIIDKCHRLSGTFNIAYFYKLMLMFIPYWKVIMSMYCNEAQNKDKASLNDPMIEVYAALLIVIKSCQINFQMLRKYSSHFNQFWEFLFESVTLTLSYKQDYPALTTVCIDILDNMWKVDLASFILAVSTTKCIRNYCKSVCIVAKSVVNRINVQVQKKVYIEVPKEIQQQLEIIYQTISLILNHSKYIHNPTKVQLIKFIVSILKQVKFSEFQSNQTCAKSRKVSDLIFEEYFVKALQYLILLMSSQKDRYIVKLLCKSLIVVGGNMLGNQLINKIEMTKFTKQSQGMSLGGVIMEINQNKEQQHAYQPVKNYIIQRYGQKIVE